MTEQKSRYDIEGLAEELEVDLQGILPLFQCFVTEMEEETTEMKRFLWEKDWDMLQRTVHNIKGVCANLKIEDVYEKAEAFDSRLKKNNIENAEKYVGDISELLKAAEEEIKIFFAGHGHVIE